MKRLLLLSLAAAFVPFALRADELPDDVAEVLEKLSKFEDQTRAQADDKIFAKRTEVSKFLDTALTRETKAANLDGALAIKKLIAELKSKTPLRNLALGTTQSGTFRQWLATIEMHSDDGWWEVVGSELVQHIKGGSERRFACKVDAEGQSLSFAANGRTYFFQFLTDRSKGIRSADDDWPARIFSVKQKK